MTISEQKIASMMKNLQCTRDEAIETIKADAEIDKMTMKEINATMSKEDKKAIKDATKTGTRKTTVYKFDTKSKPKDNEKVEIINNIFAQLNYDNCVISNEGREITFQYNNNDYSLVLTKHRPKK